MRVTSDGVVKLSVVVQESQNEKKLSDLIFFLVKFSGYRENSKLPGLLLSKSLALR